MNTLFSKDGNTVLRKNDIIRIEHVNGKAEITFLRSDPELTGGQAYYKLYYHKCGDHYIDSLLWCPQALAVNVLDLICATTGFDVVKLEDFGKHDPYPSVSNSARVYYYKFK